MNIRHTTLHILICIQQIIFLKMYLGNNNILSLTELKLKGKTYAQDRQSQNFRNEQMHDYQTHADKMAVYKDGQLETASRHKHWDNQ